MGAIREALTAKARKAGVPFGFHGWRKGSDFWSDLLTDTMSKSNKWNTLSLVPGRPLFKELGRNLMAAQAYTKHKDEMDAQRSATDRLLARLDELDARLEQLTVPLSYADELYALRSHIQMVRGKATRASQGPLPPAGAPRG